jgi:hypothetical protein
MAADWKEIARRWSPALRDAVARALRPPRRIGWIDRSLGGSADWILDCRTVRRHLSDHHDGQLPRWRQALLRAHLTTCAVCRPVDESMRSTLSLLRELGGLDPGDGSQEE